jgi:hypothetical protein
MFQFPDESNCSAGVVHPESEVLFVMVVGLSPRAIES